MPKFTIKLMNPDKIVKQAEKRVNDAQKQLNRIIGDLKGRIPPQVAAIVAKRYNIDKSEIRPIKKNEKPRKLAGDIKITGETIDGLAVVYQGRLLTPTKKRFNLTPSIPPTKRVRKLKKIPGNNLKLVRKGTGKLGGAVGMARPIEPYEIKVEILKKRQVKISGNAFLFKAGSNYIPFVRKSETRKDVEPFKTISMPQMVASKELKPKIEAKINDTMEKRAIHYMNQLNKK